MQNQNTQLDLVKPSVVSTTCACLNLGKASRAVTQLFRELLAERSQAQAQLAELQPSLETEVITAIDCSNISSRQHFSRRTQGCGNPAYVE